LIDNAPVFSTFRKKYENALYGNEINEYDASGSGKIPKKPIEKYGGGVEYVHDGPRAPLRNRSNLIELGDGAGLW